MKICYFGIYNRTFSRNEVYMRGLAQLGVDVVECQSSARGILKYWQLWRRHREIVGSGGYDAVIVGYPGHLVVPCAKLLARRWGKPVIADLLGSLSDAEEHSHYARILHLLKLRCIDWMAIRSADYILLESEAQKKYFEDRFGKSKKYVVVYTGVDESIFQPFSGVNSESFIVIFRGKLTPECGIEYILEAAEILKDNSRISFKIVGRGYLLEKTREIIHRNHLTNVELISDRLSNEDLYRVVSSGSLYLGQFEDNPRLERTIPHKLFEAFALGIPYLTADNPAVRELVRDGETGFCVPSTHPRALAAKIESLSNDQELLQRVSGNSRRLFEDKLSSEKLADKIISLIEPRGPTSW